MGARRAASAPLLAAPLVLLAACGSLAACGAGPAPAFHPAATATPSRPASASAPAAGGVRAFPFPAGLHVVFRGWRSANTADEAILTADENYQDAYYYAVSTRGKSHAYADFASALPLGGHESQAAWVRGLLTTYYLAQHQTRRGTIVFSRARVVRRFGGPGGPGQGAVLSFCVNRTRFRFRNTRTGASQPASHPYYLEKDSLSRRGGEPWLVTYSTSYYPPDTRAARCLP